MPNTWLLQLEKIERKIIETRIDCENPICEDENQARIGTGVLILIAVCHGLTVPASQSLCNAIEEEIKKLILDEFGFLGYKEVELAFRMNAYPQLRMPNGFPGEKVGYPNLSTQFVSKVLLLYKQLRDFTESKLKNLIDEIG